MTSIRPRLGYKKVATGRGHHVLTPWLRPAEAAAYCSISRSQFDATSQFLPAGGKGRTRTYHTAVLDAWIAAGYPVHGLACDAEGRPLEEIHAAHTQGKTARAGRVPSHRPGSSD